MDLQKIGRYEIKAEIGRGGMATVYRAYDPRFKREVAIKVLPSQFLHDPTFRARFEREAMTIAAIEHPGIVPVYDYGEENGQPYLVMRYMHNGSLSDLLKKGPLSFRESAHIITQLAPALDEMHARGIIHRDLKPGNILFDHYGNACISDFGIARLTEATTTLTGDAIIGTPSYMSPEQARGDTDIDGRSDIYALGAILFEMLTGKQPYQATTPMGIVMKHITEPVPRILDIRSDLPSGTESVITRAMAKKRDERFSTARDMAAAQEAVVRQQVGRQAAPTTVEKVASTPAVEKPPKEAPKKPLEGKAQPGKTPGEVPPVSGKPLAEKMQAERQPFAVRPAAEKAHGDGKPAVEKEHGEIKPPVMGPIPSTGVSRAPAAAASSRAVDSRRPAKLPSAQAFPQSASLSGQPESLTGTHPVETGKATRSRSLLLAGGALVVVVVLCLIAGVFGIPGLMNALNPSKTQTVAVISPTAPGAPTLTPQAGVTLTPRRQMDVFVDGFDKTDSGWDRRLEDGNITDYEAGHYRIYVDKPSIFYWANPGLDFADVSLEVEATKTSGPDNNFFGLLCRYQDRLNFYMLAVSSDGYFSIQKYQEGIFSHLVADDWQFSQYIHQGKTTNVLRADCIGDTLKLYVNGTMVAEAQDATFQNGDVGLTAASLDLAGTNILFDNFVAAKPNR